MLVFLSFLKAFTDKIIIISNFNIWYIWLTLTLFLPVRTINKLLILIYKFPI